MTLVLAPELEQRIVKRIESGEYRSPDEVIAYALHLIDEQDAVKQLQLDDLRRELAIGQEALDRGEYRDYSSGSELMENIANEGRARLKTIRTAAS